MSRIGFGFDVHAFASHRKLVLGGVTIPFEKGLAGHSDADVLIHAIIDSLLGAAALGDIGTHFPDTDLKYKDADSLTLLTEVSKRLKNKGYRIENIDTTLILQFPKVASYFPQMCMNIAKALSLSVSQVSVKATTTETLGFTGRGEGVAASAIALLENLH